MKYFNKEWYNNGCKSTETQKEYINYMNEHLPKWYQEFSIHDNQIKNAIECNDCLITNMIYDDYNHTNYQIKFYSPKILENCDLKNDWCLYDELYINNNLCEYHLMVMDFNNNDIIKCFTVECSNIELIINNKTYRVFGNKETRGIFDR